MTDPRAQGASQALQALITKAISPYRAWRAEGRGITAGRAIIRRDGETSDDDETYAILVPGAPTAGMDAAMLKIGGKDVYIGTITQSGAGSVDQGLGQMRANGDAQNTADNSSTSNNDPGSFVTAMSLATTLPNGTYNVLVIGSFLGGHSANDTVQFRVTCGGSNGATRSKAVSSATATRLEAITRFTGITVSGGTLTCTIEYRRGDALTGETASAVSPTLAIWATRTA